MQLDKTQFVIRERSAVDILDLALRVLARHAGPLLIALLLGALPWLAINYAMIGWLAAFHTDDALTEYDVGNMVRYIVNLGLLLFFQAPLGTCFVTAYLGQAAFVERPQLKTVLLDTLRRLPGLVWIHGMLRGVLPALLLMLFLPRMTSYSAQEGWLIAVAAVIWLIRGVRPFVTEIILLERLPLFARGSAMTAGRRSALLHNPSASDLFLRWLVFWQPAAFLLVLSVYGVFRFAAGTLLNDWTPGPWAYQWLLPLAMWLVAGYLAIVRFLNYLDLRIRQEGWEVELRMRAEAARLRPEVF